MYKVDDMNASCNSYCFLKKIPLQFAWEDATRYFGQGILDPSYFRDSVDESSLVIVNSLNLRIIWIRIVSILE